MAEPSESLQAARAAFTRAAADLRAAELAEWAARPLFVGDEGAKPAPNLAALCADVRAIRLLLEEQGLAVRLVSRVIGGA